MKRPDTTPVTYVDMFGMAYNVWFWIRNDNPLELLMVSQDPDFGYLEPYATLTAYIPETESCKQDEGFVKNWSENTGLDMWLAENGFAAATGEVAYSGYVTIPKYRFNMDRIRQHAASL